MIESVPLNFHDEHFRIDGVLHNAARANNRIMLLFVEDSRFEETLAEAHRENMLEATWVWLVAHVPTGLPAAARYQLRHTNAFYFQLAQPTERDLINDALRVVSLAVDLLCPPPPLPSPGPQTQTTSSSAFSPPDPTSTLTANGTQFAGSVNQVSNRADGVGNSSAMPGDSCSKHFSLRAAKSCDEISSRPHMYTRGLAFARYPLKYAYK